MLSCLYLNTTEIVIGVFKISAIIEWSKSLCIVLTWRLTWNSTGFMWMWLQYCTQNIVQIDFLYSFGELECKCLKQVSKEDEQFNLCHLFPQTYMVPCRKKGTSCIKKPNQTKPEGLEKKSSEKH